MNKKRLKRVESRGLSRVIMTKNRDLNREKMEQNRPVMESILTNLLIRLLTEKRRKKDAA